MIRVRYLYNRQRSLGLGDWVEGWAKPIARWVDRRTAKLPARCRTRLDGCSACFERRRRLNAWVPDIRSWRAWLTAVVRIWAFLRRPRKGA